MRLAGGQVAGLEVDLGQTPVIARQQRQQHLGQEGPRLAVEPAHDAEIDGDDIAGLVDEHVARVLVAVEEAVAEGLLEEDGGRLGQHLAQVVAGGQQRRAVVERYAADLTHGQHPARGALPIDGRGAVTGVFGEVVGQLRGGRRLHAQVHLDAHRLLEQAHGGDRLEAAQARLRALDQPGQPVEQLQVALEGALDAGPQDLDRRFLRRLSVLGRGHRQVHLGDRGGRDRRVVEALEQLVERTAQLGLDGGAGLVARERRQPVLELGEIGGQLLAQQIRAGREELAQLDEARPHVGERARQLLPGPALGAAPEHQPRQPGYSGDDPQFVERAEHVVPGQRAGDERQAPKRAEGAQHGPGES